jgi:hypothetical protein
MKTQTLLALLRRTNTTRPGIPGAVMSVLLAISVATTACQSGGAALVSGDHQNEPFCKTMVAQADLIAQWVQDTKLDPPSNPNLTRAAKYYADAKVLNAALVKAAPASLETDVALQTRIANASMDARISGDQARIDASIQESMSPEFLAAAKRMGEYCGAKTSK